MKNPESTSWPCSQSIVLTGRDLIAINDHVPGYLQANNTLAINVTDVLIKIEELNSDGVYVLKSYFRRNLSS